MSFKSFITKQALRLRGVSKDRAEAIARELDEHPEIAAQLQSLDQNKEVKALFENIQKDIEAKKKSGMAEAYAMQMVMVKYQSDIAKYRNELAPLMQLFGGK